MTNIAAALAVAHAPGRSYLARRPRPIALLAAAALAGCASGAPAPQASPAALEPALVDSLVAATAPSRPLQVTFDWALTDRDARFSGKGVVRIAPPYRGRLDLFGPRGETYAIALLQDEQLRLAPAGAGELLPPAPFLWASLGVFRRPEPPLTASRRQAGGFELAFGAGEQRWRFVVSADGLRQVEWLGPDQGRRTVELSGRAAPGLPQRGTYRDWLAFRELTLTVTGVENVDGFAEEIWTLGGR